MFALYLQMISVLVVPKSKNIIHSMIHHYQNNSKIEFFVYLLRFWCGNCMGISGLEIVYDKKIQDIKFFQSMIVAKSLVNFYLEMISVVMRLYTRSLKSTLELLEIFFDPSLMIVLSIVWLMTGFTLYDFIYYKSLDNETDEIKVPSKNLNNR